MWRYPALPERPRRRPFFRCRTDGARNPESATQHRFLPLGAGMYRASETRSDIHDDRQSRSPSDSSLSGWLQHGRMTAGSNVIGIGGTGADAMCLRMPHLLGRREQQQPVGIQAGLRMICHSMNAGFGIAMPLGGEPASTAPADCGRQGEPHSCSGGGHCHAG